jgi:transglutaminase-like putative cysteine protease
MCALCQIAGIPARYVGHYIDRHGVTECYVEGDWAYVDIEGRYFLKPDRKLASTRDLKHDPSLVTSQSKKVLAELRTGRGFDLERAEREFISIEVTVLTDYFVWEFERYNYDWVWYTSDRLNACRGIAEEFPDELSHKHLLAMARGKEPLPE